MFTTRKKKSNEKKHQIDTNKKTWKIGVLSVVDEGAKIMCTEHTLEIFQVCGATFEVSILRNRQS